MFFYRASWGVFASIIISALLAACQTDSGSAPALSLEQAKQATSAYEGAAFVPPPRTINDITAILNEYNVVDQKALDEARAIAKTEPPAHLLNGFYIKLDKIGVEKKKKDTIEAERRLASFYLKRARAAERIGDIKLQISDLRKAESLARKHSAVGNIWHRVLVDLSVAETQTGSHANAIRYLKKLSMNNSIGAKGWERVMFDRLAQAYARSGDLESAEINLEAGHPKHTGGNAPTLVTHEFYYTSAVVLNLKGNYAEADRYYRRLMPLLDDYKDFDGFAHADLIKDNMRADYALNLLAQGRISEAEIESRKALISSLERAGRYSQDTASMLLRLAIVIEAQGRPEETAKLVHAAIDIYEKIGVPKDSYRLARARAILGGALVAQGKWENSLEQFDAIKNGLSSDPETFERQFASNIDWAAALLGAGRNKEAQAISAAALGHNLKVMGDKHYNTAEARGMLAMAMARKGDDKGAFGEYSKALPILLTRSLQVSGDSASAAGKQFRLGLMLEGYLELLSDVRGAPLEREVGIDAAAEAFLIANVARGQSVQKALSASAARSVSAVRDPGLAKLVRKEQNAQKQIAALNGLLTNVLGSPRDQQGQGVIEKLKTDIDTLRNARAALMEEIEKSFPEYAELINPKPGTVDLARAVLVPGEALISTYVGKKKTYVWAIPKDGNVAFAVADIGEEDLADTIAMLRSSLEPNAATLGDIPDFDVASAYDLYSQLLKPVEAGWKKADSLLVVTHGPLGYLPLSVLPTEKTVIAANKEGEALFSNYKKVAWLSRSHAVTVLPSVASIKTLRSLPPGKAGRKPFVGFGDPYFSKEQMAAAKAQTEKPVQVAELASRGLKRRGLPVRLRAAPKTSGMDSANLALLPRLPDTNKEIRSIAKAMKANFDTDVFLGEKANEGVVKSLDLSSYKVVAFATHGLVPGELDGLTQPALALSAPEVAGVEGDGLLTMEEIMALQMDADWVVLSACNTGSGNGAGAEAASGLGLSFFYAGARALLVSNWPVETTSAKELTTDLFRRQQENAGLSRAQALRQTMVGLIDGPGYVDEKSGKTIFSYAHPIFWAPFSLIGDGG